MAIHLEHQFARAGKALPHLRDFPQSGFDDPLLRRRFRKGFGQKRGKALQPPRRILYQRGIYCLFCLQKRPRLWVLPKELGLTFDFFQQHFLLPFLHFDSPSASSQRSLGSFFAQLALFKAAAPLPRTVARESRASQFHIL